MISFWEKRSFVDYHYAIVGGGIVGLSTAASIKEKSPKSSVLVLERGIFPSGASTKNAGFACFGSLTELLEDIKDMGESHMLSLVEERWVGLQQLRNRLGDHNIDYRNYGGYELLLGPELPALHQLEKVNLMLSSIFDTTVFVENKSKVSEFKFNSGKVKNVVENTLEGQIDTGKMMKSLISYVRELGVDILTGAEVSGVDQDEKCVTLQVRNLENRIPIRFRSNYVAICTNAFTKRLIPEININPGRGQVVVTKPIAKIPFKGIFHYDQGYYYFRNFEDRVIFGGGRNTDFEGETTTELKTTEPIISNLCRQLEEIILPGKSVAIDHQWAGIMAFGPSKKPILQQISPRIVAGVRLGGMGVAIGSCMANNICQMILHD